MIRYVEFDDGTCLKIEGPTEQDALEAACRQMMSEAWEYAGTERGQQARRTMLALDAYLAREEVT